MHEQEQANGVRRRHPWAATATEAFLVCLTGAAIAAASLWIARPALPGAPPPPREAFRHRIDLHTAGKGELVLLPAIGPKRASRILALRKAGDVEVETLLAGAGLGRKGRAELGTWILDSRD